MVSVHFTWRVAQAKVINPWPCCSLFNKHLSSLTIFFSFTSDSVTKVKIDVFFMISSCLCVQFSVVFFSPHSQVCLFLKRGASQTEVDEQGHDPLSIAVQAANADIVTLWVISVLLIPFFFFFLEHEMTPSSHHPIYKRFQVCRLGLLTNSSAFLFFLLSADCV